MDNHCNDCIAVKALVDWRDAAKVKLEAMQWIPVSERLPLPDKMVLCCEEDGAILTGYYYDGWHTGRLKWRITHWMPLPEPPKNGENDD